MDNKGASGGKIVSAVSVGAQLKHPAHCPQDRTSCCHPHTPLRGGGGVNAVIVSAQLKPPAHRFAPAVVTHTHCCMHGNEVLLRMQGGALSWGGP